MFSWERAGITGKESSDTEGRHCNKGTGVVVATQSEKFETSKERNKQCVLFSK
jgi:hypothetical protein